MIKHSTFNFYSFLIFVALLIYVASCSSNDISEPVDCSTSDLAVQATSQTNPSSCAAQDGSITASGSGGKSPYQFAINTGSYSSVALFPNLSAGTYTLKIKDSNGCEQTVDVVLTAPGSTLTATSTNTADTQCVSNNGIIEVNASGGSAPYQYKIGTGAFGSASSFANLAEGSYAVTVKDGSGCTVTISAKVEHGKTGVSFANEINPILQAKCQSANCHGSGSINGDWTKFSAVSAKAALIKKRTGDKSMPQTGSLTAEQIALIACWVDDGALNN